MESQFIASLRTRLPQGKRQLLGLGDDAAVLDWASSDRCVVTSDLLAEGVHFCSGESLSRIGHKSLAVNLSDLAAMAAEPVAAFVSLLLPKRFTSAELDELYDGMSRLAAEFNVFIAGGDTNVWNGALVVSVTALGDVGPAKDGVSRQVWTRSGGQVGDAIVVSGELGGSLLGGHLDFMPRLRESTAISAAFEVHAAMDISDGLLLDLSRLLAESNSGAELNLDAVPISVAAHQSAVTSGKTPLQHALGDGEDFELLLVLPTADASRLCESPPTETPMTCIGRIVTQPGIRDSNSGEELQPVGYEHGIEFP